MSNFVPFSLTLQHERTCNEAVRIIRDLNPNIALTRS
jgi:hypothetical protein